MQLYGTEDQCRACLFAWRWPEGFVCPACGGMRYCVVRQEGRELYQCNACRTQTSLIAGTIFASTKLPISAAGSSSSAWRERGRARAAAIEP